MAASNSGRHESLYAETKRQTDWNHGTDMNPYTKWGGAKYSQLPDWLFEVFLPLFRFRSALEYRITLLYKATHVAFEEKLIDDSTEKPKW